MKFYLDSYAMIEYIRGNRHYAGYLNSASLITSMLNLMEVYYVVLRDSGEKTADRVYVAFRNYETPIGEQDVRDGMKFRMRMKARKANFSYADAVGYVVAQRAGARYLTGDDEFRSLPGVEFVK